MGKKIVNFYANEGNWKDFKACVPNASQALREHIQETIQSTDGLEEKQKNLQRKLEDLERKEEKIRERKKKVDKRLESRQKIVEKRQDRGNEGEVRFKSQFVNDKWRPNKDKIQAVHVTEPQECSECGEEINNGDLMYFSSFNQNFLCKDCKEKATNNHVPSILMTDLEVNHD